MYSNENISKKFKVIKDIIYQPFMFRPSYKEGDVLYLKSAGMLFDIKGNLACEMGSPIQLEHTEEIK